MREVLEIGQSRFCLVTDDWFETIQLLRRGRRVGKRDVQARVVKFDEAK